MITRRPVLPFTKLHGLGNDFVLIDERAGAVGLDKKTIRAIACRKRGVGFDQLLVLKPSPRVHAILDIYNADGSRAEMCGNGLRAAGLFLWNRGVAEHELLIQTAAGDRRVRALGPLPERAQSARCNADEDELLIECEMGNPRFLPTPQALKKGARLGKKTVHPVCINVGNPHAVCFLTPSTEQELTTWGRELETHKAFPRRTNVEFVRVRDKHIIEVKVWERGVGLTEACGTGAVASACAAIQLKLAQSPVEVRFPGGVAEVRWDGLKAPAFLRGHAHEVFTGNWSD